MKIIRYLGISLAALVAAVLLSAAPAWAYTDDLGDDVVIVNTPDEDVALGDDVEPTPDVTTVDDVVDPAEPEPEPWTAYPTATDGSRGCIGDGCD